MQITLNPELIKKFGMEISKGTVVLNEGIVPKEVYIAFKGKFEVTKKINGKAQIFNFIKDGEIFGEAALLGTETSNFTVTAIEPSGIIKIPTESFESLLKKLPEIGIDVIKALAYKLQLTDDKVSTLLEHEDDLKLMKHLVSLLSCIGEKSEKGTIINIPFDSIAEEIKTPKAAIDTVKKDLENAHNVIQLHPNGSVEVLDHALMDEFVQFIEMRKKILVNAK